LALANQRLLDDLLARGCTNVTVLDVSKTALDVTKKRVGPLAEQISWIVADITQVELAPLAYDVWHDRAVFHFLTSIEQRAAYVRNVATSVRPGGHVIVSTFGPEGPTKCSGLEVMRYNAESLHGEFGPRFRLVESSKELHQTPFGTAQQFLYCYCRVEWNVTASALMSFYTDNVYPHLVNALGDRRRFAKFANASFPWPAAESLRSV
jgi:SAM-dependent methyltransferase